MLIAKVLSNKFMTLQNYGNKTLNFLRYLFLKMTAHAHKLYVALELPVENVTNVITLTNRITESSHKPDIRYKVKLKKMKNAVSQFP